MTAFATVCRNPSANWPQSFAYIAQVWSGAARELFSNSWLNGAQATGLCDSPSSDIRDSALLPDG
jgi:hypothetical protein